MCVHVRAVTPAPPPGVDVACSFFTRICRSCAPVCILLVWRCSPEQLCLRSEVVVCPVCRAVRGPRLMAVTLLAEQASGCGWSCSSRFCMQQLPPTNSPPPYHADRHSTRHTRDPQAAPACTRHCQRSWSTRSRKQSVTPALHAGLHAPPLRCCARRASLHSLCSGRITAASASSVRSHTTPRQRAWRGQHAACQCSVHAIHAQPSVSHTPVAHRPSCFCSLGRASRNTRVSAAWGAMLRACTRAMRRWQCVSSMRAVSAQAACWPACVTPGLKCHATRNTCRQRVQAGSAEPALARTHKPWPPAPLLQLTARCKWGSLCKT